MGSIRGVFDKFSHIGPTLPAMGYFPEQIADLEATIRATDCDVVVVGTPFDLAERLNVDKPCVQVRYEYAPIDGEPDLLALTQEKLKGR